MQAVISFTKEASVAKRSGLETDKIDELIKKVDCIHSVKVSGAGYIAEVEADVVSIAELQSRLDKRLQAEEVYAVRPFKRCNKTKTL